MPFSVDLPPQHILGPFAPASPLREHGERIAKRGGKNAKKRAATAVARKLAVLMLAILKSGQPYNLTADKTQAA